MPTTSNEGGDASSGAQPSMITVPVNIPLPERMDLSGGNLPAKWQRFRRAWSNKTPKTRAEIRNDVQPRCLRVSVLMH